jgi:hypothetical protein
MKKTSKENMNRNADVESEGPDRVQEPDIGPPAAEGFHEIMVAEGVFQLAFWQLEEQELSQHGEWVGMV